MIHKFRRWSIAGLIAISSAAAFAQTNDLSVKLKSGVYHPAGKIESVGSQLRTASYSPSYVLIQFAELPNAARQAELKTAGIQLLEFLSGSAYWARLSQPVDAASISKFGIISLEKIKAAHKIDPKLTASNVPAHALRGNSNVAVTVGYFEGASGEDVKKALLNINAVIISSNATYRTFGIEISRLALSSVGAIEAVSFVVPIQIAPQLNNFEGRNSHRANVAQNTNTGGRGLTGNGVVVGVGEGDRATNHVDYQNRLTENTLGNIISSHKSHVTGTIAGNGNIDPAAKGMAPKATVISDDGFVIIDNGATYHQNTGMSLVNHSWRFDVHGIYDDFSRKIDEQNYTTPGIIHVVAASNEGPNFRTVGDAHIAAKNSLTVGAVMPNDDIAMFSSRGPAADGRIKPEIVGVGTDVYSTTPDNTYQGGWGGTSMSTPGVAGSLALFVERYKQLNNSATPNTGIIKAIACNTADDLGNAGPDFTYGFGKINMRRALEALEANRFVKSTVNAGASATHAISVPTNVQELKVLLYWIDKAGNVQSSQALVNDLNLRVSNGTTYLPWLLNPAPGSENNTAAKGVDHLNNIEQVSVTNPAAGNYTITVDGSAIALGVQDYVVSYEFVKKEILLSYPLGGESIQPGQGVYLRWDAAGTNAFSIDYSTNNGTSWTSIATAVPATSRSYYWVTPNTNGTVLVRVTDGIKTAVSGVVNIITTPSGLAVSNSATLSWAASAGATSYNVYLLKPTDKEMQLVANTTNLSYTFTNLSGGETHWVSVSAKNATVESVRAYAVSFIPAAVNNCTDPAWNATAAYPAGSKVSYNNMVYTANWWVQGSQPDINSGPVGSGKPWTQTGTCSVNKVPVATFTAPAKNSIFNIGTSVTLKADAVDPDGTIVKVEFLNASDAVIFTDNTAPYEYTLTGLTKGSYVYKVKAYDNLGLASDFAYNNFDIVGELPVITVTSPVPVNGINPTYLVGGSLTITATVTDPDGTIAKVEFTPGNNTAGMVTKTAAPYTATFTNLPAPSPDGSYWFTIKAYDNQGNTATQSVIVYKNRIPTIAITSPSTNATYPSGTTTVPVSVSANDVDFISGKIEYFNGTVKLGETIYNNPLPSPVINYNLTNLTAGSYALTAKITDDKGQTAVSSVVNFTISTGQNQLPVVTITSPVAVSGIQPKYLVGGSITVSANVSDPDGTITKVEFTKGGTTTGMVIKTTAPYTTTFTNLPAPLPDGSYWFNVKAYDNNGGVTDKIVTVYKNRVPSITITAPAQNASIVFGTSVIATSAVSDADFTSGRIEYFNGTTKLGETILNSTITTPTISTNLGMLSAGTYALTAKITDDMTQTGVSSVVNFTVTPSASCTDPAWNAATAYSTNQIVSRLGKRYKANYWSQGVAPETHSAAYQEWTLLGNCGARFADADADHVLTVYPSPFVADVTVSFDLSNDGEVSVDLYSTYGEKVGTLFSGALEAGSQSFTLNTQHLAAGVYIVRVNGSNISENVRVIKN